VRNGEVNQLLKGNFKYLSVWDEFGEIRSRIKTQNLQFMANKTRSWLSEWINIIAAHFFSCIAYFVSNHNCVDYNKSRWDFEQHFIPNWTDDIQLNSHVQHRNKKFTTPELWGMVRWTYSSKEISNGWACAKNLTKFVQKTKQEIYDLQLGKLEANCGNWFMSSRHIFVMHILL
jgi:hypothetical protein